MENGTRAKLKRVAISADGMQSTAYFGGLGKNSDGFTFAGVGQYSQYTDIRAWALAVELPGWLEIARRPPALEIGAEKLRPPRRERAGTMS